MYHYNVDLDAITNDQGEIILSQVSDSLSPTECDAAVQFLNFIGYTLTIDELLSLLIEDEQSFTEAETASLTSAPTRFHTFRIVRNAKCEIRVIVGIAPVPADVHVLARWVFEGRQWVGYDE